MLVGSYPVFYRRWMIRLYCKCTYCEMIFHINVLLEVANLLRFSSGHQPHMHNQEIQLNQKFQNQASSSRCLKFENVFNKALNYSATYNDKR